MTTLPELLLAAAAEDPARPFLLFEGRTLSRGEMADAALRCAGWWTRAGVGRGDRIALLLENRPELLVAWFGASLAGAVVAPLDPELRGEELATRLCEIRPSAVVADAAALPALLAAQGLVPSLRHLVIAGDAPAGTTPWRDLCAGPAADPAPLDPGAPSEIVYTAGVAGGARAVTWRHGGRAATGGALAQLLGLSHRDRLMVVLPLFAANAQVSVAMAVSAGASLLLERRFSARRFWSAARKGTATQVSLPGQLLRELCAQRPRRDDARHAVRLVLGLGTPEDVHQAFENRFGTCLVEGFGLTEATGYVTINPVERGRRKLGTVGLPVPWAEVAVLDERLRRLPPSVAGEICVRSRPGATAPWIGGHLDGADPASSRDGWLRSGDLGVFDEEGFLTLVDGLEDGASAAREARSTRRAEAALRRHPAVADAALVPPPGGGAPVAVVVLRAPVHLDALARFCREWVDDGAAPSRFKVVERIPKTASGRVRRAELRSRPGLFEQVYCVE
ncbi:MAG TPA: AMP-binding protein [Anaeromyxobacteraceae bacterium]|nr:AMP-binding protein [Anaeromyxobacteraceae bacterium]